jgi:hypothetical protein
MEAAGTGLTESISPKKPSARVGWILKLTGRASCLMIRADQAGAFDHSLQFPESNVARQILHAAIRSDYQTIDADEGKRSANASGNHLWGFHLMCGEIEYAQDDRFAAQFFEDGAIQ